MRSRGQDGEVELPYFLSWKVTTAEVSSPEAETITFAVRFWSSAVAVTEPPEVLSLAE